MEADAARVAEQAGENLGVPLAVVGNESCLIDREESGSVG